MIHAHGLLGSLPNLMLNWRQALALAAVLVVGWLALRRRFDGPSAVCREGAIIAVLFAVWQLVQEPNISIGGNALARGRWIERFQTAIHLPNERHVQDLILGHPDVVRLANLYYATMHFTVMGIFLVWLYVRHREAYPRIRTSLAIAVLGCFIVQLMPVAPPRMLPGFIDTAELYGQSVYSAGFSVDALGAMPSVHVLFAAVVGWFTWRVSTSKWRYIAPLHFVVTVFVIVATANHWWLDGIVAIALLIASVQLHDAVLRLFHRWRRASAGGNDRGSLVDGVDEVDRGLHRPALGK